MLKNFQIVLYPVHIEKNIFLINNNKVNYFRFINISNEILTYLIYF